MKNSALNLLGLSALVVGLAACDKTTKTPTPSPAPALQCNLKIPRAPDPVPAGFDWRPLAENWCKQLEACGRPLPDCVNTYLGFIANPPVDATSLPISGGIVPPGEKKAVTNLKCEDSEEYLAGQITCGRERQERVPPQEKIN